MVHKYDLFEILYDQKSPVTATALTKLLNLHPSDSKAIQKALETMYQDELVTRTKHGYQAIVSKNHQLLFDLIRFCMANKIDYRNLITKRMALFIAKGLKKKQFDSKSFKITIQTYSKYVYFLSQNGLCIILSQKPLIATIPYNTFLEDLLHYFDLKTTPAKIKDDEYFDEIERELEVFHRIQKNHIREYQEIMDKYEIQFIRHSLNLEGNPITLAETIALLRDQIVPRSLKLEQIQEVQNYQKAINQMILDAHNRVVITKQSILNYHALAKYHEPEVAGKVRDVPARIRNNPSFKIAKVEEIEPKLELLLEKYNDFLRKKKRTLIEILEFIAYFHNEFQYIHPFRDGNSRITRLLTFHILLYLDIPVMDMPLGLLEEYVSATKGSKKRDDKKLNQIMQRIILYNVKTINEKLRSSGRLGSFTLGESRLG